MRKKTYLKITKNFLQNNIPENFFLFKKKNEKIKKKYSIQFTAAKKNLNKNFEKKNLFKNSHIFFKHTFYKKMQNVKCKYKNTLKNSNNVYTWKIYKKKKIMYNTFYFSLYFIKKTFEKKKTYTSEFKKKLKEKQKLFFLYGYLSHKYLQKLYIKAEKLNGNVNENVIHFLEKRLDVILYRALFFPSISIAKVYIKNKKVLVNNNFVNIPSYNVNIGDVIYMHKSVQKNICNIMLTHFLKYTIIQKKSTNFYIHFILYYMKKIKNKITFSIQNLYFLILFFSENKYKSYFKKIKNYTYVNKNIYMHFLNAFTNKNFYFLFSFKNYYKALYFIKKCMYIFLNNEKKIFSYIKIKKYVKFYIFFYKKINKEMFNFLHIYTQKYKNICRNIYLKNVYVNLYTIFLRENFYKKCEKKTHTFYFHKNIEKCNINNKKYIFFLNYFLLNIHLFNVYKFNFSIKKYVIYLYLQNFIYKKIFFLKKSFKKKNVYNTFFFVFIKNMYTLNTFFFKQKIHFLYENYIIHKISTKKKYILYSMQKFENIFSKNSIFLHLHKKIKKNIFIWKNKYIKKYIYIFIVYVSKNTMYTFKNFFSLFFLQNKNIHFLHTLYMYTLLKKNKYLYSTNKKNVIQKIKNNFMKKLFFFQKKKKYFFQKIHNAYTYKKKYFLNKKNLYLSIKKNKSIIHYKPLNMEISYKNLTIIYLYPSQKYYFPCTLDISLLYKK